MYYFDTVTQQKLTFISLNKEIDTLLFRQGVSGMGRLIEMRERQFQISLAYGRIKAWNN